MGRAAIVFSAFVFVTSVGFSACGKGAATLNGAGATFPYPLYSSWAHEYASKTGVRLNYQSIGSGGGVKQVSERTVHFGASDDALRPNVLDDARLLQWPQVIGGIVVIVNAPGIRGSELVLDASAVCGIFLGDIKSLSDPRVKRLNKDLKLPDASLTVVHRSDGSGTTAVFTNYLSRTCPPWKGRVGEGKAVRWPTGIGGKGNEGVTNYVKQQANSVGYVEFAYAKQNRLAYARQVNAAGNIVAPTLETFAEAAASGDFDPKKHFYTWATNAPGAGAWPMVAATNILVAREKAQENERVIAFFEWAFSDAGDAQARRLDYAPLPSSLKQKVRDYWKEHGLRR